MTEHILMAYETDIDFRIHGFEKANEQGYQVDVTEIEEPGIVYKDDRVTVEAFPVSHGTLISYGYKFVTADRTIVISGDTAPLDIVAEKAAGCDILLHEVEYSARRLQGTKMAEIPPGGPHLKHGPGKSGPESKAKTSCHLSPHLPHEYPG